MKSKKKKTVKSAKKPSAKDRRQNSMLSVMYQRLVDRKEMPERRGGSRKKG